MTFGTYAGRELKLGNPRDLPTVKTCYKLHKVNEAIKHGHPTCIVRISDNPELRLNGLLLRNKSSGEYKLVNGRRMPLQYGNIEEYSIEEWDTIHEVAGYARTRPANNGWGAYILPLGVKPGDRVYIEYLIEDIMPGGFWYSIDSAVDAEGIWDGYRIKIDETLYRRFELIG